MIEVLEARRLLSFQCFTEISHAFVVEAAASRFPVAKAALHTHADRKAAIWQGTDTSIAMSRGDGDREWSMTDGGNAMVCTTAVGTAADGTALPVISVAGATAMVTRLASGSDFSGYQYIPPNGSAPPPLNYVPDPGSTEGFEFPPGGTVILTAPPKLKPSDRVGAALPSGPSVTPLAQTPSTAPVSALMGGRSNGVAVPNPVTVPASLATSGASLSSALPRAPIYLGPLAMINPGEVVFAASSATVAKAADGLAYASSKAADALSLIATPDGLSDVASYNFVHFNPSILLNDAIAAFSQESATLSFVPTPTHSTTRAWTITAAVVGFDLLLMGYCYHKSRQQKAVAAMALASGGSHSE